MQQKNPGGSPSRLLIDLEETGGSGGSSSNSSRGGCWGVAASHAGREGCSDAYAHVRPRIVKSTSLAQRCTACEIWPVPRVKIKFPSQKICSYICRPRCMGGIAWRDEIVVMVFLYVVVSLTAKVGYLSRLVSDERVMAFLRCKITCWCVLVV